MYFFIGRVLYSLHIAILYLSDSNHFCIFWEHWGKIIIVYESFPCCSYSYCASIHFYKKLGRKTHFTNTYSGSFDFLSILFMSSFISSVKAVEFILISRLIWSTGPLLLNSIWRAWWCLTSSFTLLSTIFEPPKLVGRIWWKL